MMTYVLAMLALAAVFRGSDADCYNCTLTKMGGMTVGLEGCGEPFSPDGIQTIPCETKCKTVTTTMEMGDGVTEVTIRTCHNPDEGPCIDLPSASIMEGQTMSQKCCMGNLCNGASAGQTEGGAEGGAEGDGTKDPDAEPEPPATTPSSAGFLTFSAALALFAPLSAFIF